MKYEIPGVFRITKIDLPLEKFTRRTEAVLFNKQLTN
jgi:hypothetical protein